MRFAHDRRPWRAALWLGRCLARTLRALRISRAALDPRTRSQDAARTAKRHWGENGKGRGHRAPVEAPERPLGRRKANRW
jgi:uncharacterized protein with PIN domain